jgi:hypothetical protein
MRYWTMETHETAFIYVVMIRDSLRPRDIIVVSPLIGVTDIDCLSIYNTRLSLGSAVHAFPMIIRTV